MDVVIVAALVVVFLSLLLLAVSAIIDAARTPTDRWRRIRRGKGVTIVLIVLTGGFGGIYYWWRIRSELRSASQSSSHAAPAPLGKRELRAIEAQRYLSR